MRIKPATVLKVTIWILILCAGMWMRIYKLDWGGPWWFHPDERNIASAVTRIHWPDDLDPEFFAYGSFPIYLISVGVELVQYLGVQKDPFAIATIISRAYSAILSVGVIFLTWRIGKYFNRSTAKIAAVLTTFTVGFIQFAHYGTFEMWLTAHHLLLLWAVISYCLKPKKYKIIILAVLLGIGVGIKITSLIFLPVIGIALYWPSFEKIKKNSGKRHRQTSNENSPNLQATAYTRTLSYVVKNIGILCINPLRTLLGVIVIAVLCFFISNPLVLNPKLDWQIIQHQLLQDKIKPLFFLNPDFVHSINVEGEIARGDIEVFYTRQFINTVPGLFQFLKVYPYILGYPVTLLGMFGFIFMLYRGIFQVRLPYLLTVLWFILQVSFLFTLYVKWSRYLIPTLPYLIISASWFVGGLSRRLSESYTHHQQALKRIAYIPMFLLIAWQITYAVMFIRIYRQPDPRITAAEWARDHLPQETHIFSEVYDMGIVPMNPFFRNITLFNFYELDHPALSRDRSIELNQLIETHQVFVILSRRVWANSINNAHAFPQTADFYTKLFAGELGFTKVAEFSAHPGIGTFLLNDELYAEETFNVFDHPHIQIWVKDHTIDL